MPKKRTYINGTSFNTKNISIEDTLKQALDWNQEGIKYTLITTRWLRKMMTYCAHLEQNQIPKQIEPEKPTVFIRKRKQNDY